MISNANFSNPCEKQTVGGLLACIQSIIFFLLFLLPAIVPAAAVQTVVLQQGLNGYEGTDDTYISQASSTTNYGTASNIYFTDTSYKSLVRFDLASIPATATINSATLSFYIYANSGNSGSKVINAYRVLTNWVESQAIWQRPATGTSWATTGMRSGTDYVSSVAASSTAGYSPVNVWTTFDLKNLVQSWVNGTSPNYGVVLRSGNGPRPYIYSSEYLNDLSLRPKLTITYTTDTTDVAAPTVPESVTAAPASSQQINLAWISSTDDFGVFGYKVFRDGAQVALTSGTSYQDNGLVPATTYYYTVSAFDIAGNESAPTAPVSATTQPPPDTIPPSVPTALSASAVSDTRIDLTWSPSSDNIGVTGYRVFRNGVQVATTPSTAYSDTGLSPTTSYTYTVAAFDAAGNTSAASVSASATTPDTQPPSIPQKLTAIGVNSSQIDLTWLPSSDNVGVTGYKVFRDGNQVATTTSTSYADTGLLPATIHTYTVAAFDAAANTSAASEPAIASTFSGNEFAFVTYGDNRAGSDCTGNAIHINLVNRMAAENPVFTINNGDMITGYTNTTNFIQDGACTAQGSYGSLLAQIAPLQNRLPPPGLPTAYFPVLGNHDDNWGDHWYPDPYGNGFCDVFNPQVLIPNHTQKPYFSGIGATRYTDSQYYSLACSTTVSSVYPRYLYYSFNYANSHFVVLRINNDYFNLQACNSCGANKANYSDYYNIHQLDFLQADLAAARNDPQITNIFVFLHTPLFGTSQDHPNNVSWPILSKEFSSRKVKAVFSGHSHLYERTVPILVNSSFPNGTRDDLNGTVYITTGGGGSPLADFNAAAWYDAFRISAYHFVKVIVDGTIVTIRVIDANGNLIESFTW